MTSPDTIRLTALMEDKGTRRVGTGRVQNNNGALYGLLPQPFAGMLGAEQSVECEVFVNLEEGVIIHRFNGGTSDGQ